MTTKLEQRERTKEVIAGLKLPWQCSVVNCKNAVYPDFQALLSFIEDGIILCEQHHFGRKYQEQRLTCSKLCEDQIQERLNGIHLTCQRCGSERVQIDKVYIRQYLIYGEFCCANCRGRKQTNFSAHTNGNGHHHQEGGNGSMKLRMKPAGLITKTAHILQGTCQCYYVHPDGRRCSNLVDLNDPAVRSNYMRHGQAFCRDCLPKVLAGKRMKQLRRLVRL